MKIYRNNRCGNLWQGCQFWNRTFEEEMEKVDVAEIRQIIDQDEADGEETQC